MNFYSIPFKFWVLLIGSTADNSHCRKSSAGFCGRVAEAHRSRDGGQVHSKIWGGRDTSIDVPRPKMSVCNVHVCIVVYCFTQVWQYSYNIIKPWSIRYAELKNYNTCILQHTGSDPLSPLKKTARCIDSTSSHISDKTAKTWINRTIFLVAWRHNLQFSPLTGTEAQSWRRHFWLC